MNREQKIAWSFVIATSLGFVCSIIAVAILYVKVGMPKALAGLGFLGIAGLGGLAALIFKKDTGKGAFDERDAVIKERAGLAGYTASFLFVGLACMIPFFILGPKATISVSWLPRIFNGAVISHFFVHSIAVLIQYGWEAKKSKLKN